MVARIPIDPDAIERFCRQRGIRRLSLFGSVLRSDFGLRSDVDVLVRFDPHAHLSMWDLLDVERDLSQLLGRTAHVTEESGLHNPYLRRAILDQREIVYDR